MEPRLNAAVIGCGRMGAFTSDVMRRHAPPGWFPLSHAEAVAAHPELHLVGVADQSRGAAVRAAQVHGVADFGDDVQRLLDHARPALVTLATRTQGRAALIGQCLAAGVRALHVEKPLCNSMAEWQALSSRLDRGDVFVTYGALRRHLPVFRAAMAHAAAGELGPLREARVQFGAGSLFWTQTHAIDLLLWAAGGRRLLGVQAVLGDVQHGSRTHEVENDPEVLSATLVFEGGLTGIVSRAHGSDFVLSCRDGEIAVRGDGSAIDTYRCQPDSIYPTFAPLALNVPSGPGGTLAPISQLVDCVRQRPGAAEANRALRADMLLGQQVAFAFVQSYLEGSRLVDPSSVDDRLVVQARHGGRHA